ncbi:Eco29kI restriction endonuclease [Cohaesibacter sp. ES.047]|uniref:Eco29kI family restriction endonuclease n=1 Tax=Cohaesibacter sp. ES.047 TaxID=1798205 RepID=UPI000BB8E60C|nr:Eco29kI family restriction endonuclease [Cohaesibacter sp. ES.047]SNY91415.1 Eco29kI restriction endonuclease [Cohaesibacter sp. ES.047]
MAQEESVTREFEPFDPLARTNLAASAAEALLDTAPEPLNTLVPFWGAGVYAIYYTGDFPAYSWIAKSNDNGRWLAPLYVGKAIPSGGRKGSSGLEPPRGKYLFNRLNQHAESVRAAENLNIEHFHARFLVVVDIFIPLIENLMISRFAPIWNNPVDGFGNHDPGAGRRKGMRPRWDVLHPGRRWADLCGQRPETQESIAREVEALLSARAVPDQRMIQP